MPELAAPPAPAREEEPAPRPQRRLFSPGQETVRLAQPGCLLPRPGLPLEPPPAESSLPRIMLAAPGLRLLTRAWRRGRLQAAAGRRAFCAANAEGGRAGQGQQLQQRPPFETGLLDILVCPLSKKPLRYEESTSELINDELGIAYPIVDGIPNMIPEAARMIGKESQEKKPEQT